MNCNLGEVAVGRKGEIDLQNQKIYFLLIFQFKNSDFCFIHTYSSCTHPRDFHEKMIYQSRNTTFPRTSAHFIS